VAQNADDAQAAELQAALAGGVYVAGAVELGSVECKAALEDTHSLSLTALVVVDYSSGGPILPEHEDLWMGTAYASRWTRAAHTAA
jgi:hypothetical protein